MDLARNDPDAGLRAFLATQAARPGFAGVCEQLKALLGAVQAAGFQPDEAWTQVLACRAPLSADNCHAHAQFLSEWVDARWMDAAL
ncbi:MAG TPA: hypothetical protein VFQ88_10215 [Nevskiaceae bacterium]|nr:hypothetical protein [Nevskiaceae bacterium]